MLSNQRVVTHFESFTGFGVIPGTLVDESSRLRARYFENRFFVRAARLFFGQIPWAFIWFKFYHSCFGSSRLTI